MIKESYSSIETEEIARDLAEKSVKGDVFCLIGDLGCGKTVFAKGFAKGLGIGEEVLSPTFTIINEYEGRLPFYHFDIYRILHEEEMQELGYEDYFYGGGICLVEWANQMDRLMPDNAVWITISKDFNKGEDYRMIEIVKK